MVVTNQVVVIILGIAILVTIGFFIAKLLKSPQNKGKEIGLIIGELMIAYPMTWFFGFILFITLAEALLAASLTSETASPLARIMMHTFMGLLSVFAAMIWIKELYNVGSDIVAKSFRDAFISLGLAAITAFLTFFTPILNLIVIANNLKQITHVSLLFDRLNPFISSRVYFAKVYAEGFDIATYNPLAEMHDVMLATIGGTVVHLMLILWEALKILRSKRESTKNVLNSDNKQDPKDPPADKDKDKDKDDKGKDKDKDKDKEKDKNFQSLVEKALRFLELSDEQVNKLTGTAMKVLRGQAASGNLDTQAEIAKTFGELHLKMDKWKADGMPDKGREELKAEIRQAFRESPKKGGLAMSLPKN